MVTTRLQILNNSVAFPENIPVSITFVLADVREPDKRNASFSKTIRLYGNNEVNKFFNNIYEVNTRTLTFNKNLKTSVEYYVNDDLNFKGDLQLIKISRTGKYGVIIYECSIIGEGGSLFIDIGDKLITGNPDPADDLDFSAYDHAYTRTNIMNSWATPGAGAGYYYPFVHRGTNGGSDTVFSVKDFLPCFFKAEIVKQIIEKTGRTYDSSILKGSEFAHQLTYPNIDNVNITQSQLDSSQFYVGLSADFDITGIPIAIPPLNNESTPFFDLGNQCFSVYAQMAFSGEYNFETRQFFAIKFTHTDPTVTRVEFDNYSITSSIQKSADSGATWTVINNQTSLFNNEYSGNVAINTDTFGNQAVATGSMYVNAGEQFRTDARYSPGFIGDTRFYDAMNNLITTGTGTLQIRLLSGSNKTSFYALLTSKATAEGNTISMNKALPVKIKQKDFLKSIIQALNLQIDIDPADNNNLIIESYNDYYNGPIKNWENRTDLNKEQTVNPNLIEGKRYLFTYKSDADLYNEKYKQKWGEVFGTETIEIESDFKKEDKKNEIIFSATPNVANYDLGIAHPKIFKNELASVGTITPNIRWLYAGGIKQTVNPWTFKETGQPDITLYDYGYAGHTDDPFNPTIDLNFGIPKQVYYDYINAYFTTNNLYNRFHKNYLENLTDRDSRFETRYLWATSKDIKEFSFRNRYFIDGAYWIVNKIVNYDPLKEDSTQFELIKLLRTDVFVPINAPIFGDPNIATGSGVGIPVDNSSLRLGNSINKGKNCISIGDGNYIPASASNVTIIGNNVTVAEGVINSSVINTDNYNLEQANFSITNNVVPTDLFRTGTVITNNATPTKLLFDTPTGEFDVQLDQVLRIEVRLLAVNQNGTRDSKEWVAEGVAEGQSPPTYQAVLAPTSTIADVSMITAGFSIVATGTPGDEFIEFQVTGIAATDIIWKCQVEIVKIDA